tara:strand:+ start:556 stop:1095 length:540 start_codon:yes stop_codon:yes gene_type:complete
MESKLKIAVGYKAGCGKDTFCNYLSKKFNNYKTGQIAFADPIYDIMFYAQHTCGFNSVKDRKFLQFVGTEWGRSIQDDIWINIALSKAKDLDIALISDLRFNNEFQTLKENGWFNVKIVRDNISSSRIGSGSNTHPSETELNIVHDLCWDYIIENNGTLDEFHEKIDIMLKDKFGINID